MQAGEQLRWVDARPVGPGTGRANRLRTFPTTLILSYGMDVVANRSLHAYLATRQNGTKTTHIVRIDIPHNEGGSLIAHTP